MDNDKNLELSKSSLKLGWVAAIFIWGVTTALAMGGLYWVMDSSVKATSTKLYEHIQDDKAYKAQQELKHAALQKELGEFKTDVKDSFSTVNEDMSDNETADAITKTQVSNIYNILGRIEKKLDTLN